MYRMMINKDVPSSTFEVSFTGYGRSCNLKTYGPPLLQNGPSNTLTAMMLRCLAYDLKDRPSSLSLKRVIDRANDVIDVSQAAGNQHPSFGPSIQYRMRSEPKTSTAPPDPNEPTNFQTTVMVYADDFDLDMGKLRPPDVGNSGVPANNPAFSIEDFVEIPASPRLQAP